MPSNITHTHIHKSLYTCHHPRALKPQHQKVSESAAIIGSNRRSSWTATNPVEDMSNRNLYIVPWGGGNENLTENEKNTKFRVYAYMSSDRSSKLDSVIQHRRIHCCCGLFRALNEWAAFCCMAHWMGGEGDLKPGVLYYIPCRSCLTLMRGFGSWVLRTETGQCFSSSSSSSASSTTFFFFLLVLLLLLILPSFNFLPRSCLEWRKCYFTLFV